MSARPPNCPPDLVITCGPFAEQSGGKIASTPSPRQRFFQQQKTAVDGPVEAWESGSPTSVAVLNAGGETRSTPPVYGSDVNENQDPPAVRPMEITSGADGNKRGGIPPKKAGRGAASDLVRRILLQKKRPAAKSVPEPKAPQADGGPRPAPGSSADPVSSLNPSPGTMNHQTGNDPVQKLGGESTASTEDLALALVRGALLGDVSRDSIVWLSAIDKVAQSAFGVPEGGISTQDVLRSPSSHPMTLGMILSASYGESWLEWDLEVVKETLKQDFGVDVGDENMNKIAAVGFMERNPGDFFLDWNAFEKICLAMNGEPPRIGTISDLDPQEMVFAISCAGFIRPSLLENGFGSVAADRVKAYCAARLFEAGLIIAPPSLSFADELLLKMAPHAAELAKKSSDLYAKTMQGTEDPVSSDDIPPPEYVQVYRLMKIAAFVMDKNAELIRVMSSMNPVTKIDK